MKNYQQIHTIPSHDENNTRRFKRKQQRLPLAYDKYLVGRSYQLLKTAIHSKQTLQLYKQHLFHFCDFVKMTTEEIVSKYGGENVKESIKLQHMIEDYTLLLQTKITSGEITAGSAHVSIPPVKLLCEMNDIILNWRKINKLLPHGNNSAADEAYTREQIKKMLEYSDLRAKIPILFMSSSGMRLGGFTGLTDGCIKPIYDDKTGKKLLAAHVVVYKGTDDMYDTFISPEAFHAYEEYRNLRIKFGEKLTKNSPILLRRFDISPDGESASIDNTKPLALSTVAGIIRTVAYKAGVREVSENYNQMYNVKIAHGFRKYFSSTLSNIKVPDGSGRNAIDFIKKEWLLGHSLMGIHALEENYNRNDRIKMLFDDYLKAVKELTISDEERLLVENQKLKVDISNMKTVESQLTEKDRQIIELVKKQEKFEQLIQSLIDTGQLKPLS